MLKKKLKFATAALAGLLYANVSAAMSLDEAVAAALKSDQRIDAAQSMVEAQESRVREARGSYLPTITLDAAVQRQDEPYTFLQPALAIPTPFGVLGVPESELPLLGRDLAFGELSISQVLYAGGQRSAGVEQARTASALARATQHDTQRTVRAEVEQLFIQRWHAEQVIAVTGQTMAQMSALSNLTSALLEGGSTSLTRKDAQRAALAAEKITGIAAQVQSGFAMATRLLQQKTGRRISGSLQDPTTAFASDEAGTTADVLASHPQVEQLQLAADIAAAQARQAQGERLPVVRLRGGLRSFDDDLGIGLANDTNRDNWSVAVEVRVPLFNGGSTRARISRALSEQKSRSEQRRYAESAIAAQYEALQSAIDQRQTQLAATERARDIARHLYSLTRRSAGRDADGIAEQIEASVFLALAEVDHLNAKRDYLLAKSGMRQLLGAH